jgi:hypothetical protein
MAITWPNFLWLVSAEPYRRLLFALPWQFVPARIAAELHLLAKAFMWWGLPVGLLGLQGLFRLNRSLAYSSLLTVLLVSAYSVGYNTTDSYVYLLPVLLIFSLWIGWGLFDLGHTLQRFIGPKARASRLMSWVIILLPLLSLGANLSEQDISQDDQAFVYAQQSLQVVASNAVIISDDDARTFALWYGRYGLGLRPDVAIVNDNLLPYTWYRELLRQTHSDLVLSDQTGQPLTTVPAFVEGNLPHSPIYLATLQPPRLDGYRLEPLAQLRHVVQLADGGRHGE